MGDTQASLAGGSPQADRLLAVDTPLGPDAALLIGLEGEDALSRCFVYHVTIATEQSDQAVQSLLGKPVTLWLCNHSPELRRPINGHVRRLVGHGTTPRGTRLYKLEVVPRLWFLNCSADCRIFQNQSIPDIIQTIFTDQGLTNVEFRVMRDDYPRVEYCVQYRETAFNFVSRLMEHLGLFYWHEHSADRHLLVIADRNASTAQCQPAEVTISPLSGAGELQSLEADYTFRPGRWVLNDYDFQSPTKLLRVDTPTVLTVPLMANHEMYDFPGIFMDQDIGRWLTRRRIELEEAQQHHVFGTGRAPGFDPGRRFSVSVVRGGAETSYLLTEVRHHASDPLAETGDDNPPTYSNDFVAIPADKPFRPERVTPKSRARGAQTATVVGPPGENIHCDEYGRVRVQFHWDRRGQRNDQSSCWIRVSQARAGSYYGTQVIPHVGHEVIVAFLEDDPDRPLIVGTVPNALTMPPLELPRRRDKTVQRDHGGNKIIMHGKSGLEHLSLASPRAINMVSAVGVARPLSADVTFAGAPGQAASADIDPFKDPAALNQLLNTYNLLSGGDDTNANPNYLESGTTGDYADAGSFNTVAEQNINSLSIGNSNAWVYGCSNSWVHTDANSLVVGNTNSLVKGNSASVVEGGSESVVLGNSVSFTLGGSETTVVGGNVALTLGGSFSLTLGANLAITLGVNQGISLPVKWDFAGVDLRTVTTRVDDVVTRIDTVATHMKNAGIELMNTGANIRAAGMELLQADLHVIT